jgi:hypothetical protein
MRILLILSELRPRGFRLPRQAVQASSPNGAGFPGNWRRFPSQAAQIPPATGAGLILSWVPAPAERMSSRKAWQAPALFWNLRRQYVFTPT